jgi:predicted transcriptional regulator
MGETEVESILREIRERVLSRERSNEHVGPAVRSELAKGTNGNSSQAGQSEMVAAENLALINSYLTTTARTWDRLPPLVSNRSGLTARLELWLKRRLRVGTRWFTWEQVNFNAAVHHALRDVLQVLSAYEQELTKLSAETNAANEARRMHETELDALRAEIAAQRQAIELVSAQKAQVEARLTELVKELRERDEHLRDEQRVCLKQLSLETTEAAVLEERARRKAATQLEELRGRIEELEADE